jgi:hypothetical protein
MRVITLDGKYLAPTADREEEMERSWNAPEQRSWALATKKLGPSQSPRAWRLGSNAGRLRPTAKASRPVSPSP